MEETAYFLHLIVKSETALALVQTADPTRIQKFFDTY